MRISGNSGAAHVPHINRVQTNSKKSESAEQTQTNETEGSASATLTQDSAEKQKGVIRNLLAGHYKGVADVRLRINFFDELSAIEEGAKMSSLQSTLPNFQGSLDQAFSVFLENKELSEEQLEQITKEKNSLDLSINNLLEQKLSSKELFDAVQSETNTFFETIKSFLESPSNEIVEQDELAEPVAQASDPLSDFKDQVTSALSLLETEGLSASILPELSEPSGNGAAYEKFLAIYQELQSGGSVSETEQEASIIDTEA